MLRQEAGTAEEEVKGQRKKKVLLTTQAKTPKGFTEVQVALEFLCFLYTVLVTPVPYTWITAVGTFTRALQFVTLAQVRWFFLELEQCGRNERYLTESSKNLFFTYNFLPLWQKVRVPSTQ